MRKIVLFIVVLLFSSSSLATKIKPTPLNELIEKSDYILIGTVKDVKIFNKMVKRRNGLV